MKFLVDNALSPDVAEGLRQAGHDAVHVPLEAPLRAGSVVVFDRSRVRIRRLPIGGEEEASTYPG